MYYICANTPKIEQELLNEAVIIFPEGFDINIKNNNDFMTLSNELRNKFENSKVIVAFENNELIGFGLLRELSENSFNNEFFNLFSEEEQQKLIFNNYVSEIVVKSNSQNKRVGTCIMEKIEELSKGKTIIIRCNNELDNFNKVLMKLNYYIIKQEIKEDKLDNIYFKSIS